MSEPASEWPWWLIPPTTANAPGGPAAEGAANASPPVEHDESETSYLPSTGMAGTCCETGEPPEEGMTDEEDGRGHPR